MMQHLRRSVASTLARRSALLIPQIAAASVSSSTANVAQRLPVLFNSFGRNALPWPGYMTKDVLGSNVGRCLGGLLSSPQLSEHLVINNSSVISIRQFASRASDRKNKPESEPRKEVSKVEDPFDAPTYNIPEKPVTFVEGASYSFIILIGLGIAAAAAYAVFNELIFQPKEYKIFNKALKRIQDDGQVRVRIGSPIKGYGQETRNRAARQRIPHRIWTDEDGVEQIEVNFYVRGPQGAGKVFCHMFKDKEEKDWKFTSLIVQIMSPSPAQLLLESYVPA